MIAGATKDLADSLARLDTSLEKLANRIEAIETDVSELRGRPGKCPHRPGDGPVTGG